ncbi:hypothetical protein BpHYR1_048505 [Brachionus plicatilis]|uniref:Uncharacterized protein n=1 Tax=Brachionus plicatilis TaxID=10195 RepID=A0A3M7SC66_BRAPC|nr:hypothetical protein BpHYR1_048505 [Brachionus plicatilis]
MKSLFLIFLNEPNFFIYLFNCIELKCPQSRFDNPRDIYNVLKIILYNVNTESEQKPIIHKLVLPYNMIYALSGGMVFNVCLFHFRSLVI